MGENHPVNIDKRPKRRKSKDNPYTIYSTGVGNGDPHYYISFSDTQGDTIKLEISKELFEQFDRWELEDISVLHEYERHYEHSELTDSTLNRRALHKELTPEERILCASEHRELRKAFQSLTKVQQRRLVMYFEKGMSYKAIAESEGCKYQAIQDSIERALKKLKKF